MDPTSNNIGSNQLLQTLSWLHHRGQFSSISIHSGVNIQILREWFSTTLLQKYIRHRKAMESPCLGQNERFRKTFLSLNGFMCQDEVTTPLKIIWKKLFWSTPYFCVRELQPPQNNSENYWRSSLLFLVKTMLIPKYVLPNYFEVGASFS